METINPKNKQPGRPKSKSSKSKKLTVYYTMDEFNYLTSLADKNGYKHLSKFIHTLSLKNVEKLRPMSPQVVVLTGNLKHIGANINQIARALNRANMGYISISEQELQEYKQTFDETILVIKEILNLLENE